MNNDLAEHLVNDKDNKFHETPVALHLSITPGMTLDLYLEVQKIWESMTRSRVEKLRAIASYTFLLTDLRDIIRRNEYE